MIKARAKFLNIKETAENDFWKIYQKPVERRINKTSKVNENKQSLHTSQHS